MLVPCFHHPSCHLFFKQVSLSGQALLWISFHSSLSEQRSLKQFKTAFTALGCTNFVWIDFHFYALNFISRAALTPTWLSLYSWIASGRTPCSLKDCGLLNWVVVMDLDHFLVFLGSFPHPVVVPRFMYAICFHVCYPFSCLYVSPCCVMFLFCVSFTASKLGSFRFIFPVFCFSVFLPGFPNSCCIVYEEHCK